MPEYIVIVTTQAVGRCYVTAVDAAEAARLGSLAATSGGHTDVRIEAEFPLKVEALEVLRAER